MNPRIEGNKNIPSEVLQQQIRTKENKRILFGKPYLNLYYFAQILESDTGKWKSIYLFLDRDTSALKDFLTWIRNNLAEEPAYLDTALLREDLENLRNFYFAKGFFYPEIKAYVRSLPWDARQVEVIFRVEEGKRAYIYQIHYLSQDSDLVEVLNQYQDNAPIRIYSPYDEEQLNAYRIWIAERLKNHGYYTASANDIAFLVDTSEAFREMAWQNYLLSGNVGNPTFYMQYPISLTVLLPEHLHPFWIDSVTVMIEEALPKKHIYIEIADSSLAPSSKCNIVFQIEPRVPQVLNLKKLRSYLALCPPEWYKESQLNSITRQLLTLDLFNFIAWDHDLRDSLSIASTLYLRMKPHYQLQFGIEGFQSQDVQLNSNLPGLGGQIAFVNQNLLGFGEKLELFSRGNLRFYQPEPSLPTQYFFQYNQTVRLRIPRLWIIGPMIRKWASRFITELQSPATLFSSSWTVENRPEFSRSVFNGLFQYQFFHIYKSHWRISHKLTPLQLTRVESKLSQTFERALDELPAITRNFILRDYIPRLNTSSAYQLSLSYHYEEIQKIRQGCYIQFDWESGGNIPYLIDYFQNRNALRGDGSYKDGLIDSTFQYGQFWRIRLDVRYRYTLFRSSALVIAMQLGIAQGWNYTIRVPFDYRFFAGGINVMRGWQSSTLGPGTFSPDILSNLIVPGGEYLFTTAIEIRQPVISPFELAFFVEAGNTWFSKRSQFQDPRGFLVKENLQLGWDAGIGLRLNFDYFLLRFDLAQQIYSPDIQKVIVRSLKDIGGDRWQFNFGIGYPF
jgi:hypothetical protein